MRGRAGVLAVLIAGCSKAPASATPAAVSPAPAPTASAAAIQNIRFFVRASTDSVVKLAQFALRAAEGTLESPRVRGEIMTVATRYVRDRKGDGGLREVTVIVAIDRTVRDSLTHVDLSAWATEVQRDRRPALPGPGRRPAPSSVQTFARDGPELIRVTPKDTEDWLVLEEVLGAFLDQGATLSRSKRR